MIHILMVSDYSVYILFILLPVLSISILINVTIPVGFALIPWLVVLVPMKVVVPVAVALVVVVCRGGVCGVVGAADVAQLGVVRGHSGAVVRFGILVVRRAETVDVDWKENSKRVKGCLLRTGNCHSLI
jgi:hypothetical protein